MSTPEVFQALFYFCGIISLMLGIYTLYMNPKAELNKAFFLLCMSLFIWALGFSMAINAPTLQQCLFWRRVSALGWGSMYGFLLHFSLAYSRNPNVRRIKGLHPLIYAPAFVTVFVFGIFNGTAQHQYLFIWTSVGWVNHSYNNLWDLFFDVYYIGYMVLSLILIGIYGWKSPSEKIKKQVRIILFSFFAAFLAGTGTDILFNSVLSIYIPQVAPIIILIPVITIYYSIMRYGLMKPGQINENEVILTESARPKVYGNLSKALVAGGFLSFIVQYMNYHNVSRSILPSGLILLMGVFLHFFKSIKASDYAKDILLLVIVFVTVPGIILQFIDYGGVTVWSVSFLFIVVSMVFNKPVVLISTSISIVSTEVLLWMIKPEVKLSLDASDYVGRLGILCITIWFSYYVNKVYIRRLGKNADQLNLQMFISEVSSDFINVDQTNIEEKMNWVLAIIGKLFSMDRINILLFDSEHSVVDCTNIWNAEKKSMSGNYRLDVSSENFSWMMDELLSSELIYVPDINKLSGDAAGVREVFNGRGVCSFVAIPIEEKGNTMKLLEFTSTDTQKTWRDEEIRTMNIIANIFDDALSKVEAEKEISHMAYHDHLTGLPNRRLFTDRLSQAIALAKRTEKMVGVVYIDLDSFKSINDAIGHEGGDLLLKLLSKKLVNVLRTSDTVSRYGGDEFLILLNNIADDKDIGKLAEKLMMVVREPIIVAGQEFSLTTSIGVSVYPFDGRDIDTLIRHADTAMYKAKENGKNKYVISSTELKDEVFKKIKLTNNLHRALAREELYLNYQPQVSASTGAIIGMEALIRWRHPEMGFVSPVVFIPIAEQTGVIYEIGEWVLRTACSQNKKWQDAGHKPVCIAVNVSAHQLRNDQFTNRLKQILDETGLDPKYLEVEITESAAMSETGNVATQLGEIRKLGVMIAIDDFGTDYSSLSRLKALPIDKIKIDKQFVDGIEEGEKDQAIVRTILNLAQNLNLRAIAEGVEDERQLAFLKKEGCEEIQGYFYFKPLPVEEIEKLFIGKTEE